MSKSSRPSRDKPSQQGQAVPGQIGLYCHITCKNMDFDTGRFDLPRLARIDSAILNAGLLDD